MPLKPAKTVPAPTYLCRNPCTKYQKFREKLRKTALSVVECIGAHELVDTRSSHTFAWNIATVAAQKTLPRPGLWGMWGAAAAWDWEGFGIPDLKKDLQHMIRVTYT